MNIGKPAQTQATMGFPVHSAGLPENRRHMTRGVFLLGLCNMWLASPVSVAAPHPPSIPTVLGVASIYPWQS